MKPLQPFRTGWTAYFDFCPVVARLQKAWSPQDTSCSLKYSDKHFSLPLRWRQRRKTHHRKKSPQRLLSELVGPCLWDCHLSPIPASSKDTFSPVDSWNKIAATEVHVLHVERCDCSHPGCQEQTVFPKSKLWCDFLLPATHSFALSRDHRGFWWQVQQKTPAFFLEGLSEIHAAPFFPVLSVWPVLMLLPPPLPPKPLRHTCLHVLHLHMSCLSQTRACRWPHSYMPQLQGTKDPDDELLKAWSRCPWNESWFAESCKCLGQLSIRRQHPNKQPQPTLTSGTEADGSSSHQCPCPPPLQAWHSVGTSPQWGSNHNGATSQKKNHTESLGTITGNAGHRISGQEPRHQSSQAGWDQWETAESKSVARLAEQPLNCT